MSWASAIPLIGDAVSAFASYKGVQATNRANASISQKQMDFQREMSNTEYQRSMNDMRKAGLNPILAYQKGGASTPAGASIPAQNTLAGASEKLGNATEKALRIASAKAQIANTDSDTQNKIMNTRVLRKEEGLKHVQGNNLLITQEILRSQATSASAQATLDAEITKVMNDPNLSWLKKLNILKNMITK